MTPDCTVCGNTGFGAVHLDEEVVTPHCIERRWTCTRGHQFATLEVPPTFLASKSFRAAALGTLHKRIARWHRDWLIREQHYKSGHAIGLLAQNHNLTKTRIAQILK